MTVIRVVDFETSGMAPPEAEVCEVGLCDLELEERLVNLPRSWLCRVNAMPPEMRAIHHLTLAECEAWPPFDPAFLNENAIDAFAAHNAAFEMQFFTPNAPMICTYKAALRIWPDAPSHSNGTLRYWLEDQGKITLDHAQAMPPHRAGPDSYVTAHILLALFNAGATGRQMVAWTKEPALLPRCPLGKFRGARWSEVEEGFLSWMTRQPTMEEDLRWNAERELRRRQGLDIGA